MRLILIPALLLGVASATTPINSNCTTPGREQKPVSLYQQVSDGPWKSVSKVDDDPAGDPVAVARVYKIDGRTRVVVSTSVAGDIDDFALYCFDEFGKIEALRFEATTAWDWTYTRDIDYAKGAKKADSEKFFKTRTKEPLKENERETWIREHVQEYLSYAEMPFLKSNSQSGKAGQKKN